MRGWVWTRLVAGGCTVAGFGLILAAELLPWLTISLSPAQTDFPTGRTGRIRFGLDQLGSWELLLYNLGWTILLILVAVTLGVPGRWRGVTAAAGLGAAAGQLAVLVGLAAAVRHGGGVASRTEPLQPDSALGPGVYAAFAAIALLAVALLMAAWPGWSDAVRRFAVGSRSQEPAGAGPTGAAPATPAAAAPGWGSGEPAAGHPSDLTVTRAEPHTPPAGGAEGGRDIDSIGGSAGR